MLDFYPIPTIMIVYIGHSIFGSPDPNYGTKSFNALAEKNLIFMEL